MTDHEEDVVATLESEPISSPTGGAAAPPEPSRDTFFDELEALEEGLEAATVDDFEQVMDGEKAEATGREFEWPLLKGCRVHIAHFSAAVEKKAELEAVYRKRKSKLPSEQLTDKVQEKLWREAMFGTVVKGWSGFKRGGYEQPFNLANYRAAMESRKFRLFVMAKSKDAQNFVDRSAEELSGN